MDFRRWLEQDYATWTDEVEEASGIQQVSAILQKWGATDGRYADYLKQPVLTFLMNGTPYVISDLNEPEPKTAEEWVHGFSWAPHTIWEYLPERDFNKEFWEGVTNGSVLYHGTTEDNWEDIQREGLGCRDDTRGTSNRNVGCAVFTSHNMETTDYYYDIIIQIDVGQMKADGYMPRVSQEPEIEEAEALQSLASAVGVDDFHVDIESGMDPETVIFDGGIPKKYLSRVNP